MKKNFEVYMTTFTRLNLAANLSYFQPRGNRGASSPGSLQDSHRHIETGHGGGQPEALVPGQQVSFGTSNAKTANCDSSKVCVL